MAQMTAYAIPAAGGTVTCELIGSRVNDRYANVSGINQVYYYKSYRLTATQAVGYTFAGWQNRTGANPDSIVSTTASVDVEILDRITKNYGQSNQYDEDGGDVVYAAVFSGGYYTVTTASSPASGGTATGGGQYQAGSTCTITATPNSGYYFVKWTSSDGEVSTNNPHPFTVTKNITWTAKFHLCTNLLLHGSSGTLLHGSSGTLLHDA